MKTLLFILSILAILFIADADISIKFLNVSFRVILNNGGVKKIDQDSICSDSLYKYKDWYCIDTPIQKALQTNYGLSQDFLDTIEEVPDNIIRRFANDSINMELCINAWEVGVLPSIKMAQAIIESASGTSVVCKNTNNFFGIRCMRCDSSSTYSSKKYSYFRSKKSCFEFHDRNYNKLGRYHHLIGEKDIYTWATQLRDCYYASDDNYPKSLMTIIMQYDLYKLDEIAFRKFHNKII